MTASANIVRLKRKAKTADQAGDPGATIHTLQPLAEPLGKDALAAAHRLYRATLELLAASDNPARDRHHLAGPLSQVVAGQRTRIGQADCADLARALAACDHPAALNACSRLIEIERERQVELGDSP